MRGLKDLADGHRAFATDGRAKRPLGSWGSSINIMRGLKDLAAGHRAFATDGRAKRPLGSCHSAPHRPQIEYVSFTCQWTILPMGTNKPARRHIAVQTSPYEML
jgi:hypothetical protein